MDRVYDLCSPPIVHVLERAGRSAPYDDPTMDGDHVRFDLRNQSTVIRMVFGNDAPIGTDDTPQIDSRRLRRRALRRSYVVVHFRAGKGDWLLRVRDVDSHLVGGYAGMAGVRKRSVAWDGRGKRRQTLLAKRDFNNDNGFPFCGKGLTFVFLVRTTRPFQNSRR